MVMNGFDTNFDLANEFYAVNTVGFPYMDEPIAVARDAAGPHLPGQRARVRPDQLVPHARQLLQLLPDRDLAAAAEFTDTVMQCQGQRGILELSSPTRGSYMFHAHKTEFAELGWMGFFEVGDDASRRLFCDLPAAP